MWVEQDLSSSWMALPSLALSEGSAAWGYAERDCPSEMWSQHACLSVQPEEKQKAAQQFSKLQTAMKVLGISLDEQKACWLILAAIYHLGAAGATKGNPPWVPTAWLISYLLGELVEALPLCPHPAQLCYQTPLCCLCLFPIPHIRAEGSKHAEEHLYHWTWMAVMQSITKNKGAAVQRLRG